MGHSTAWIPISLEGLELAEKAQDNSLVLNYLLSFSTDGVKQHGSSMCIVIEFFIQNAKWLKGLSILGPFGFSYSLKKKKITAFFILLSVSLHLKKVVSSASSSPETGSGQADILISQVQSISLLSISFTYLPLTLKGHYFQLEN